MSQDQSANQSAIVLDRLYATIAARRGGDPAQSYSARLFNAGRAAIVRKVGEEAVETVIAGLDGDDPAVVGESADLLYHLLVLWAERGIGPDAVWQELARREGTSGIAEKASRQE